MPKPEDRRETRVLRGLAPFALNLRDDLLGDALGNMEGDIAFTEDEPAAAGVGGSSASICSTSHDRFSSRSLSRSAYEDVQHYINIRMTKNIPRVQPSPCLAAPQLL